MFLLDHDVGERGVLASARETLLVGEDCDEARGAPQKLLRELRGESVDVDTARVLSTGGNHHARAVLLGLADCEKVGDGGLWRVYHFSTPQ